MRGRHLSNLLIALCTFTLAASAQSTVPAFFLSDIHLDPFADPAKVARLNTAPASEWAAILAAPASDPRSPAIAKLQLTCPVRGTDTPNALWQSSLRSLRTEAAATHPRFITISGDLLAHQFDCRYHGLLPNATPEQYVAFTGKTIRYILASLKTAVPNTPIYMALGNNDSGCKDYQLAPTRDPFLATVAQVAAEVIPEADRASVLATFPDTGSYAAPLAGVPETRIIVVDNLFLSASYGACGGAKDPSPGQTQIAWLSAQLADARAHNQHVWVMGHIPPTVDLYNTARRLIDVCSGRQPIMFLGSDKLRETLAANADVIRLALFGHTHSDEMELITPEPAAAPSGSATATGPGIPVKVIASITPVNGNRPTYTIARIDPATATLKDFTVYEASNLTGVDAAWAKEYTYSTAYRQPAFDGTSLSALITGFQADPKAESDSSQNYLKNYFPGDISSLIRFAWPQYTCSMNHQSPAAFAACVCKGNSPATILPPKQ